MNPHRVQAGIRSTGASLRLQIQDRWRLEQVVNTWYLGTLPILGGPVQEVAAIVISKGHGIASCEHPAWWRPSSYLSEAGTPAR